MRTDGDLVKDVLAGRRDAYAELVRRYERSLLAQAATVLGDLAAAQDATQEAFLAAFRKLRSLRNPDRFGGWITRIARRKAMRMARRDRKVGRLPDEMELADGTDRGRMDGLTEHVLEALERLPATQRRVVLLKYFAGHSADDIARITGQRVGTVYSQLSRAMARLRERLGETQP